MDRDANELDADDIQVELRTDLTSDEEVELLATGKGILGDRRVDLHVSIRDGRLQERRDFYDNGELFHSGDWHEIQELALTDEGEAVTGVEMDKTPLDEWVESYTGHLYLELTEIWEDRKAAYDDGKL